MQYLQEKSSTCLAYCMLSIDPLFHGGAFTGATNKDLEQLVRDRRFRDDLWFRLNVFPIRNPSLRAESLISPLVRYFPEKVIVRKIQISSVRLNQRSPGQATLTPSFFFRYENLTKGFKQVCDRIGIPQKELPHRNASNRQKYTKYYDEELVDLVRDRFIDDQL